MAGLGRIRPACQDVRQRLAELAHTPDPCTGAGATVRSGPQAPRRPFASIGLLRRRLLGRHAQRAVEPDGLAIEHRILNDVAYQDRVLRGLAKPAGMVASSALRTGSGSVASIGVSKVPGAMVHTRTPIEAWSRAIGKVIDTTPPLEAEYAACPICPS
jgi:hypothetical protein